MSATMGDIARLAGVSVATVGRVLNRKGYASRQVRQRVEEAAARLGYVPDSMARALKSSRSGLLGVLVLGSENNLYQRICRHITEAAEERGYQVLTVQAGDRAGQAVRQLIGLRVEGLAVVSNPLVPAEALDLLHSRSIPVAAVERTYPRPDVDNIRVLDADAVYGAVRRLLELGHRRVGLIAPRPGPPVERERAEGFRRAMEEAGVPEGERLAVYTGSYHVVQGKLAAQKLLALPQPPTAVLCASDILAAGAMQAFYAAGLRVPEDVSLVGYDNTTAAFLAPPVDSVDLDLGPLGGMVLDLLERRMRDPDAPARTLSLGTVYVSRGTVRALEPV